MKAKQIIILIFIVVILALAGVFLYKAFFSKPAVAPLATSTTSTTHPISNSGAILPHGDQLNFDKVKKFNPTGKIYPYPTVTPDQTGAALNNIISQ